MKCDICPIDVRLKRRFITSGGAATTKRNYVFILDDIGLGEAAGSVIYGPSPEVIENDLKELAAAVAAFNEPGQVAKFINSKENNFCSPAICAVSTALIDLQARRNNETISRFLNLPQVSGKKTSLTISVGDMKSFDELAQSGVEIAKIKMDNDDSHTEQVIETMNRCSIPYFRIDANGSWDYPTAIRIISRLPKERIELIEQPFPPEFESDWARLQETIEIPLIMDESIKAVDDIKRVAGYVDGVNIKMQKSGSLTFAVAMMKKARELGLKVMVGCMIESSVGIAAAYQLSGIADYLDLDGRWLLQGDPFEGLVYDNAAITISGKCGHGISFAQ